MKLFLLIPLSLFSFNKPVHPLTATYYYFCYSHAMNLSMVNPATKQYIQYTEVKSITCEVADLKKKVKEWQALVESNCHNQTGCSSDLNYYETAEKAKMQLQKLQLSYRDTTRYQLQRVDF